MQRKTNRNESSAPRAKKSLGQNFLKNHAVVREMITAGEATPGESIVEIGPGRGILTAELLRAGAKVIALEKDDALVPLLQEKFAPEIENGQLILLHKDALKFEPASCKLKSGGYKLIANIPYYITGEILRYFLTLEAQPSLAVLMVQKEVADRIAARDGKESILSLSVKCYGEPKYIKTVKAQNFSPAPNVDSAILLIKNISRKVFQEIDEQKFFTIVKTGFAQKRKKLFSNLLKTDIHEREKLAQTFQTCKISENARAEDISLEQWKCLCGE